MITFENVSKTFDGGVEAVINLSMQISEGETVVLLGTSGSGKTTTMKMVNRLVEPTSGRISIEGADVMAQDPIELRRKIGYAIQHIGLFPHMTVGENIAVVPTLLRWSPGSIAERVDELLSMVGLDPAEFRDRVPTQLSGGQQQRVGVARALAADPPIVLMDEPFGALDPITREQLQNEFLALESEIRKTVIFVTHDVFEAVKMGDRVALLDAGRLQQLSTPSDLVEHPANEFVEGFLGLHRLQLSLITRTLSSLLPGILSDTEPPSPEHLEPRLEAKSSLVEALDVFRKSGRKSLPVHQDGRVVGVVDRSRLLAAVTAALAEVQN